MSTPTLFRSSGSSLDARQIFLQTADLLDRNGIIPSSLARLSWDERARTYDFLEDSVVRAQQAEDILDATHTWDGFAICYHARSVWANIYIYFGQRHDCTEIFIGIDEPVLYARPEGAKEGEWLERFICEYAAACKLAACAYGQGWPVVLSALEPSWFITELKEGGLLSRPQPCFYLLSEDLVSGREIQAVLSAQALQRGLRYFRSPYGQHVFSSLCWHCKGAWE